MAKSMTYYERLCEELCLAYKLTIEVSRVHGRLELLALAPDGMFFRSEGTHSFVECQTDEPDDEVWARMHERIIDGVAYCSKGGCNKDCELAMLD